MKDREYAEAIDCKAEEMLTEYTVAADTVYASVYSRLRK